MGGRRLSSWSCYCSPIDGARCRASLLSRYLHYCQLGSFDVDASFLCGSWHSFARSHALRLPLPRGKTLENFLRSGSADCREKAADTASSAFFLRTRFVRKNVLFSEFLVSHTISRRRLPQTLSYSSAHSSASPSPVGTSFLRRREQIACLSSSVQKIDEFPQMQFLDRLMIKRLVPGRDGADNCGGSAVAWGPCGDSAGAVLGQF